MSSSHTLPAWLANALAALKNADIDGYMELYAPAAVHEFPFAPPGRPSALSGYDAIRAFMSQLPAFLKFGTLSDVRVHPSGDQVIVEATGHHRRVSDDAERTIRYVWVITHEHGKVTRFRDYMNPLELSSL